MTKSTLPLFLLAALLGLSQCKKKHDPAPTPESQLPPATQTGANTFGCLLNGKPWIPDDNSFGNHNYVVSYDPSYAGGSLNIMVKKNFDKGSTFQGINVGGARIAQPGVYPLVLVGDRGASFADYRLAAPCNEFNYPPTLTYRTGAITITRLDVPAGIISGTFHFKLAQPGCDTITVTQGRFDKKLR